MAPVWISHRGYKAAAVENTVAAFDAACAQGFRVLETDLQLTADGHIVLHHDPGLQRLFNIPRLIATMSRAELADVSVEGAKLCFLDEFMQRYAHCEWVFDIKPETAAGVIGVLTRLATEPRLTQALSRTTRYVTWRKAHERQLRRVFSDARYYARERECWRAGLAVMSGLAALGGIDARKTYSLPPRLGSRQLLDPKIVAAYKKRGARVVAFLPELEADVRQAIAVGCDEILTNGAIIT